MLDRRIVIEQRDTEQDDTGEEIETWYKVREIFAGRKDVRAAERFAAQQSIAEIDTVFTVRWFPGLEYRPDTYRVREGGRLYRVSGITEIGRRKGYEIAASARTEEAMVDA